MEYSNAYLVLYFPSYLIFFSIYVLCFSTYWKELFLIKLQKSGKLILFLVAIILFSSFWQLRNSLDGKLLQLIHPSLSFCCILPQILVFDYCLASHPFLTSEAVSFVLVINLWKFFSLNWFHKGESGSFNPADGVTNTSTMYMCTKISELNQSNVIL